MKLKESELIINNNRIYHLGLAPGELAPIIITVGDPKRVERVSRHFDQIDIQNQQREFVTHTGSIGGTKISVVGTGIGSDNIDILINEADALFNIDFKSREIKKQKQSLTFIRMGTSGALQKNIPVDSIIGSSHGLGLDGLLNFYQFTESDFQSGFLNSMRTFIPSLWDICLPTIFPCDTGLAQKIGHNLLQGITLTAGGFYAPQGRQLRLSQKMRTLIDRMIQFEYHQHRITNFEMETSSIYGLSALLGHKAFSVNAIIANRALGTFSKDPYRTIDQMIESTLEKIIA